MDGASAITAFSSVLTSTVKFAEKAFEIAAVDSQAKAVLQTVNQVSGQLRDARTLRRQKSSLFSTFEKRMFDDTFRHTDEAISQTAALAEPARVDMEVTGGRVRANTRLLFVLRDSPNIHVSLTKLGIVSQSLNMAIFTLSNREGRSASFTSSDSSPPLNQGELRPPPTYEESMFISDGRERNARRRESALCLNARSRSTSSLPLEIPQEPPPPPEPVIELGGDQYLSNFVKYKDMPSIKVTEIKHIEQESPPNSWSHGRRYRAWSDAPSSPPGDSDTGSHASFFSLSRHPMRRAWSGAADLQANELFFEAYSPEVNQDVAPIPAMRTLSGNERRHRWLHARCR